MFCSDLVHLRFLSVTPTAEVPPSAYGLMHLVSSRHCSHSLDVSKVVPKEPREKRWKVAWISWYFFGIYMVFICIYSAYMVFIWYLYGIYMVFIWYLYGIYMVFIWYLYGIYVFICIFICIYACIYYSQTILFISIHIRCTTTVMMSLSMIFMVSQMGITMILLSYYYLITMVLHRYHIWACLRMGCHFSVHTGHL